ncbi:hypothetical protein [Alteromonas sp. 5E99-2]|nr:hypothetical protein [Alteromonas sp. 5E99-2]
MYQSNSKGPHYIHLTHYEQIAKKINPIKQVDAPVYGRHGVRDIPFIA